MMRIESFRCDCLFSFPAIALLWLLLAALPLQATTIQIVSQQAFLHDSAGLLFTLDATDSGYFENLDADGFGELGWHFTNTGAEAIAGFSFTVFLDPDLDPDDSVWFFEYAEFYGLALHPAAPAGALAPVAWEIDEPGFLFGDIVSNASNALGPVLDNTNAITADFVEDVSFAFTFNVGSLLPNQTAKATVQLLRAASGAAIGHIDTETGGDAYYHAYLTLSSNEEDPGTPGEIPEPSTWLLMSGGLLALLLARNRSHMVRIRLPGVRGARRGLLLTIPLLMLSPVFFQGQGTPDLVVAALDPSGLSTDGQSLVTMGSLVAQIRNLSETSIPVQFQVRAFEDRNGNGTFDQGTDLELGTAMVEGGLAANTATDISIPVQGTVLFAGNLIYVTADSGNVVAESDEGNNTRNTGDSSAFQPPIGQYFPSVKWQWTGASEFPDRRHVTVPAVVAQMDDDNGDGVIDENDIPDVLVVSIFDLGGFSCVTANNPAYLRLLDGRTGALKWTSSTPVQPCSMPAVADLDNDGIPEIVAHAGQQPVGSPFSSSATLVLSNTGQLLHYYPAVLSANGNPAIGDVDNDGRPEILHGWNIYRYPEGTTTNALNTLSLGSASPFNYAPVLVDLDLDGDLEVVSGLRAYHHNHGQPGVSLIYGMGGSTGHRGTNAVGNFDDDPYPEIVVVQDTMNLYLLEHTGAIKWGPISLQTDPDEDGVFQQQSLGVPVVADFDGDGMPDIGLAGTKYFTAYDGRDGSVKWRTPSRDDSMATGATAFDFEGDGRSEIIYNDELYLRILDGTTGAVLWQTVNPACTGGEYPIVADVDGDGSADIIVPRNTLCGFAAEVGITESALMVYSDPLRWVRTRKIWNQYTYHITNINPDNSVPQNPTPNWLVPGLNNFRLNNFGSAQEGLSNEAPNLRPSFLRRDDSAFPGVVTITSRIGNGGAIPTPGPVKVAFFRGDPRNGGTLIARTVTPSPLAPGEYADVSVEWLSAPEGLSPIVVVADWNSNNESEIPESNEDDNFYASDFLFGVGPFDTVDLLTARFKSTAVDLAWGRVDGAVTYTVYRRTGQLPFAPIATGLTRTSFSNTGLTNGVTYHYVVRWVDAAGMESIDGTEMSATPTASNSTGATPPTITSRPVTRGIAGSPYSYLMRASDPDVGDVITWSLEAPPNDMTISPAGLISWVPGLDAVANNRISVRATDSTGRFAQQKYYLFIETQVVNSPPLITSAPITSAVSGNEYLYQATAIDPDGGLLTWSLTNAPAGMAVNPSTGLVSWTPARAQVGSQSVALTATDSGGLSITQNYSINTLKGNKAPIIQSLAPNSARAGQTYAYAPVVTDPEDDPLTFILLNAPAGATVNPGTGAVSWIPTAAQVGLTSFSLRVTDDGGLSATQLINLDVLPQNSAPIISSNPESVGEQGLVYLSPTSIADPDGDAVTVSFDEAPVGMIYNQVQNRVEWPVPADATGSVNVTLRATDTGGLFALQSWTIQIVPEDNEPPVITFHTPAAGATITGDAEVRATITDATLKSWVLEYQAEGASNWIPLATGTTEVVNAPIGNFPGGVLKNNPYRLQIRAEDKKGIASSFQGINVNSGELKQGRFELLYEDLRLQALNVPIFVQRSYDSSNPAVGDFGPGWQMGLSEMDIRRDINFNVFVTLPSGRRVAFAHTPQFIGIGVWTNGYTAALPGVTDTLVDPDCPSLFGNGPQDFLCNFLPYTPQRYILSTTDGYEYEVGSDGLIRKITDRQGRTVEVTPTAVVSSFGRGVTMSRDGEGKITEIRDARGNAVQYGYDALGRLSQVTDQAGNVTTYGYQGDTHYLLEINAPNNCQPLRNDYYPDGRLQSSTDASGFVTSYTYNLASRTTTSTDALGRVKHETYDVQGNRVQLVDPAGGITTYAWDSAGRPTAVQFPTGRLFERAYDLNGNMLTLTDRPAIGAPLVTIYTYDVRNLPLTEETPDGQRRSFTYDTNGNVTRAETRNLANSLIEATDYGYDVNSNLTSITDGLGQTTTMTYDSFGEMLTQTNPLGQTSTMTYDVAGNLTSLTNPLGFKLDFAYNPLNLLASTKLNGATLEAIGYNERESVITETDALGRTIAFAENCRADLVRTIQPNGAISNYGYNAASELTAITDPLNRTIAYTRDALGSIAAITTPDGATQTFARNGESVETSRITANGAVIQSTLDGLNRIVRETRPEGHVDFTLDGGGRITQAVENFGGVATTQRGYDPLGRLLSETDRHGRSITYQRNLRGQPTTLTAPDGSVIAYGYDNAGRLNHVAVGAHSAAITYNAAGNATSIAFSNGASSQYTVDPLGRRLSATIRDAGNTVLSSYAYQLDANGKRIGISYHDGNASFLRDNAGRLASQSISSTSLGSVAQTFAYDNAGNRLDAGSSFGPDHRQLASSGGAFGYDAAGNRLSFAGRNYVYDSLHRLVGFTGNGNVASYEYDFAGRRIAKTVNGLRREYVFDADGNVLAEYQGGVLAALFVHAGDVDTPLIMIRGGQPWFFHTAELESVVAVTDAAGNLAHRYGYDAWGTLLLSSGAFQFNGPGLVNPLTFTSREYDEESGLYHYRARAYDPAIGRFLQKDSDPGSLRAPLSQHPYLYVGNDPLNFIDPTGNVAALEKGTFIETFHNGKGGQALGYFIGYMQGYGVGSIVKAAEALGGSGAGIKSSAKGGIKFADGLKDGFNAGFKAAMR
ncbi:MAG: putative Ig domain-containing protein [Bryobacterales bacterium]|nr:putative Ig domain-containing protein [Bryobacterales bacterium]